MPVFNKQIARKDKVINVEIDGFSLDKAALSIYNAFCKTYEPVNALKEIKSAQTEMSKRLEIIRLVLSESQYAENEVREMVLTQLLEEYEIDVEIYGFILKEYSE